MMSTVSIEELWRRFKLEGDEKARDELIYYYIPFVEKIAHKFFIWLPSSVDREDLISNGVLGLITAIDRFRLDTEARFESFAFWRIKGQMLDFLRSKDLLSKNQRIKIKKMEDAFGDLEKDGQVPTEEAIAEKLGCSIEEVLELMKLSCLSQTIYLSDSLGEDFSIEDTLGDERNPVDEIDKRLIYEQVLDRIKGFSEKEQQILQLYFLEGFTLKEIGEILSLSESRVSQMLSRILFVLRQDLKKKGIVV